MTGDVRAGKRVQLGNDKATDEPNKQPANKTFRFQLCFTYI